MSNDTLTSNQMLMQSSLIRFFAGRTLILLVLSCRASNVYNMPVPRMVLVPVDLLPRNRGKRMRSRNRGTENKSINVQHFKIIHVLDPTFEHSLFFFLFFFVFLFFNFLVHIKVQHKGKRI